ncbi:flagellar assembly protein FliW [Priestia taiwanensis]|uniref:Flagellar assembly factor FliW n=1 Tax=Priestia taiwanensis TaxID=1347902 RepID=A0A917EU87_9BACI|nr:flagellar assembly protein FliW [Priestia taiwanensis]MBM7364380.1 flagellar assembly factor FliW [Priestia taiwanensis]GGE84910.1 flagellar assembly factor FliW [Priestia taiwanensis]
MNIQTKYNGEVIIGETDIIAFEKGIPAFEEEKEFIILPLGEGVPYYAMQSIKTPSLAFVIADVFSLFPTYDIELSQHEVEELKIQHPTDIKVFTILTIHEPFEKSTANLQAPIIVNTKEREGKQVVLSNVPYTLKHSIAEVLCEKQEV